MIMKCKYCKHQWDYKGNSEYYVTCPRCYNKIKIERVKGGKDGRNNKD